jgi:hypothetical protein
VVVLKLKRGNGDNNKQQAFCRKVSEPDFHTIRRTFNTLVQRYSDKNVVKDVFQRPLLYSEQEQIYARKRGACF